VTHTYYLVQPGDTLFSIAWRHDLEVQQLAGWNGIRPPAYQIFPDQRLRLKAPEVRQPATHRTRPATPPPPPPPVASTSAPPTVEMPPERPARAPSRSNRTVDRKTPEGHLKLSWQWPTQGKVVQTFARDDDNRKGIWIQGAMGQPVKASEAGKVVYAGNGLVGYGNLIIIKHDQAYLSAYGYNSKLLVNEGDRVNKGEVVARMGSPNIGGQPMLHFEIRRDGKPVNPLPLLPQR
jgi:lipoprotein NlpD